MSAEQPTGITMARIAARPNGLTAAQVALEQLGWTVERADLDLEAGRALVTLKRRDGLIVSLDASHKRASLTRESMTFCEAPTPGQGRWRCELIGRDKWQTDGARAAMRALAHYIADNAMSATPRIDGRRAVAALIQASDRYYLEIKS